METRIAVRRLAALAQENRLAVFRLLVQAGGDGMAAGTIARALGASPNTLSAQLAVLANAGLVTSRRDGRSIIYSADLDGMAALLRHLVQDCCAGRPEVCGFLATVSAGEAGC
jgi:ArsR family transcriptional regulator, arsenate/arsenite/antimonite-responsive transcriptional repressor